ncbi:MAG: divalent-cation tolerance protein CutA [Clostridiales bacterium]|nr:divalent-cation tolerance protein CutA [Clostridiales bacterium]
MDGFSIVMTTCGSADKARQISSALLDGGLAACVQAMPIESHYIWEGEVQNDDEVLLMIKGKTENYEGIEAEILRLHDYDLPEIIRVPIEGGLAGYLAWLAAPK